MSEEVKDSTKKVNAEKTQIHSKIFINGHITTKTGLHIGGNSVGMAIGGADNVVVRNGFNNQPYIPGSSLRGKMRSLLERLYGWEQAEDEQCANDKPKIGGFSFEKDEAWAGKEPETVLGKLFGVSAGNEDKNKLLITPTRLLVRDAMLSQQSVTALQSAPNLDMPMTEIKTEVAIDRITSAANPRQFERVPSDAVFEFSMILTLLEEDENIQKTFLKLIFTGFELLEEDALGGHGSRGYGQVKLSVHKLMQKTRKIYCDGGEAQPYQFDIPKRFQFS